MNDRATVTFIRDSLGVVGEIHELLRAIETTAEEIAAKNGFSTNVLLDALAEAARIEFGPSANRVISMLVDEHAAR